MIEVTRVKPLNGYWLRLILSNGDIVERDVSDLLSGDAFEAVRSSREVFEAALIDCGTVAWPGRADIAPETLIWNGPEPSMAHHRPKARLRLRQPR